MAATAVRRRRMRDPALAITALVIAGLLAFFVIYPLGALLARGGNLPEGHPEAVGGDGLKGRRLAGDEVPTPGVVAIPAPVFGEALGGVDRGVDGDGDQVEAIAEGGGALLHPGHVPGERRADGGARGEHEVRHVGMAAELGAAEGAGGLVGELPRGKRGEDRQRLRAVAQEEDDGERQEEGDPEGGRDRRRSCPGDRLCYPARRFP